MLEKVENYIVFKSWHNVRLFRHLGKTFLVVALVAAFALDCPCVDDDHTACHPACQCLSQCHVSQACPPSEQLMVDEALPVGFVAYATQHFELLLTAEIFRPPIA